MTPVWLAVSKHHPLAGREGVHLRELASESWIFLSRDVAPAYHQQLLHWCQDEGFRPNIVAEPSRSAAMLALIAINDGIGFVPEQLKMTGAAIPELHFLRVLSPFAVLPQAFAYREGRRLAHAAGLRHASEKYAEAES